MKIPHERIRAAAWGSKGQQLLLTGLPGGEEEILTAASVKKEHINDSTTNEILTEAGAIGLVSYAPITKKVVLVPVNGAQCPTGISAVKQALDKVYAPAIVSWDVLIDTSFTSTKISSEGFKDISTNMLSKYTSNMNRVIGEYKKSKDFNKENLYLFFIKDPQCKLQGFMPLTGQYGFIFNFGSNTNVLGHELGHGTFNLRHTFSDKAQHYFPERSTQNLMDYANGTELWKYQWDLIHDPQRVLFAWKQDESEGQSTFYPINPDYTALFDLVYKYEYEAKPPLMSYLQIIENSSQQEEELSYSSDDSNQWTEDLKSWIDTWKLRVMEPDKVIDETKVVQSIKEADPNVKIGKILVKGKKIYLGNYNIENDSYSIAVYGDGEKSDLTGLFTKRTVNDVSELADVSKIKHVYCDEKMFDNYLVIAFYESGKNEPSLMIQIMHNAFVASKCKEKWLSYLGIYRDPIENMTVEEIFAKHDVLTASEIAIVRNKINEVQDEQKKGDLFLELQTKVAYRNQRDNKPQTPKVVGQSKATCDNTCNVTSLAMAFEMLGVSKEEFVKNVYGLSPVDNGYTIPDNILEGDFEDLLEYVRYKENFGDRTAPGTWDKLASLAGLDKFVVSPKSSFKNNQHIAELKEYLRKGCGIVMSLSNYSGHIVRLQDIDETGVVIDDPFGSVTSLAKREFYLVSNSGSYNIQEDRNTKDMDATGKKGKDVPVTWNEFNATIEQGKSGNEEIKSNEVLWTTKDDDGEIVKHTFEEWFLGDNSKARCTISEFPTREETIEVPSTEEGSDEPIMNTETIKYYITKGTTIKFYKIYKAKE